LLAAAAAIAIFAADFAALRQLIRFMTLMPFSYFASLRAAAAAYARPFITLIFAADIFAFDTAARHMPVFAPYCAPAIFIIADFRPLFFAAAVFTADRRRRYATLFSPLFR